MLTKRFGVVVLILCASLLLQGCPKKPVTTEDLSLKKAKEAAALEAERAAKLEAERREREEKELARIKEEEARKRALAEKELEAEKERAARLEAERAIRESELRAREEEARRALAEKELEAERERAARLEAEKAVREAELRAREEEARRALAEKEFEKTLMARQYPGIEGEVFESTEFQDVYFDYDKYDIRPSDVETIQRMASLLMKHPKVKIQIEGHCDERGTQEYNLALGERRANSVKQYLISLGIADDRISTISYGEERPVDPGHDEEAYRKNRRAHFIILSK